VEFFTFPKSPFPPEHGKKRRFQQGKRDAGQVYKRGRTGGRYQYTYFSNVYKRTNRRFPAGNLQEWLYYAQTVF